MLRASVARKVAYAIPHDRLGFANGRFIKSFSTTTASLEFNKEGKTHTQQTNRKSSTNTVPKRGDRNSDHNNQGKRSNYNNSNKGKNIPPWQDKQSEGANVGKRNNPWSNAKKGDTKAERRIADALRGNRNSNGNSKQGRNNNGGSRNNNNRNANTGRNVQRNDPPSGGIDKLRQAFMQSLSADRERRQANVNLKQPNSTVGRNNMGRNQNGGSQSRTGIKRENSNSESRLDQLLRMSKQKPPPRGGNSSRERRFDGQGQGANHYRHNNQHNQQRSNEPSEAQMLKKELMRESSLYLNKGSDASRGEVEIDVLLPNRAISLLELSSILRQQKAELARVLRDLGESLPRGGTELDEYKIDTDMAELVALELGLDPKRETRNKCSMEAAETRMRRQAQDGVGTTVDSAYEVYPARPPVVCIMGHVDHGKNDIFSTFTYYFKTYIEVISLLKAILISIN